VRFFRPSILLCASFLFAGRPTTEASTPNHHTAASTRRTSAEQELSEPSKIRPHRGIIRPQVRKLYGDPDNQQVASLGETWFYFFNPGRYFIPYYFGKSRRASFHFNEAGIFTDFEHNHEVPIKI
jgi:hypothetical protein